MKTAVIQCADTTVYLPVVGSNLHRVGNDGSIWTKSRFGPKSRAVKTDGEWRLMNPLVDQDGYMRVSLGVGGKVWAPLGVHSLVLTAFVGECPPGMEACHNDGNPANNALYNLRWDTPSRNNLDKRLHGTQQTGERNGNHKLTDEDVRLIRSRMGGPRGTVKKTAEEFGISRDWVREIWDRKVRKDVT